MIFHPIHPSHPIPSILPSISMTLTLKIRFGLILIVEGRIKTYMCNFLVNRSDSRVVVYGSELAESRVRFLLVFLLKKFPLILSKLNARSGIRTHYLEKSTLIFIREITLKFLKGIPFKIEKWRKIKKNWIVRNFLKNLKIDIFFDFFAEDVLKSLLRGPKTIRKTYQVVFEKFANQCLKKCEKTNPRFWRQFLKNVFF